MSYANPAIQISDDIARLVLEAVHPSQFRALPPSPYDLADKARQIGLIDGVSEVLREWRINCFGRGGWFPSYGPW